MIIGVTGPICAGKGELAKILRDKYGFEIYSFRDELVEDAKARGIDITRSNLQELGHKLSKEHGEAYWAQRISQKIQPGRKYVVEGFRELGQIAEFRKFEEFVLVGIISPNNLRYHRYSEKRKRQGEIITREAFDLADERDKGEKSGLKGQSSAACYKIIDHGIVNDGTLEDLKKKVYGLLKELEVSQ